VAVREPGGRVPLWEDDPSTLAIWAERVWISILDRDGAVHGRLAEEGVFQRFHPRMDREYDLDVRTGLFTPAEDGRWRRTGSRLRIAGASVSHPHILNVIDWRQEVPVAGGVDVLARFHRERSLTARRDYPRVGVRWGDAFGGGWTAGAHVGVHFSKPAADVELTVARSWGGREGEVGQGDAGRARWRLELGVAALDAFSDLVFQGLGVDDEEVEARLDYRTMPLAARAMVRRASPRWRAELHAGATTLHEARVTVPDGARPPFTQRERVGFAGALVDVTLAPGLVAAAWGTVARADTDRRSTGPGFSLREETVRVGLRPRVRLGESVRLVGEVERVWRPEERTVRPTVGPDERLDHRDRATFGRVALLRRPATGWTGRLAWTALDRRAGVIVPGLTATNHRLVTAWGWRFPTGFEVVAGIRWDLDVSPGGSFDGGHVRISGRW
jgi:hypothetical protein